MKYNSEKTFISGSGNWEFWGKKKTSFWRPDLCLHKYVLKKTYSFSGLNKFLRIMKTKINQQKMHKLILDNLLLINHSNMFRPLSRSHHQGVRNSWKLQSHCIVLLECCYVYVFALRYHIATRTHIHNNILTEQYNGFVTLKNIELPDDGFDWGAETCWSDWSVINYPELICAFCWFIFVFIIENARSKK